METLEKLIHNVTLTSLIEDENLILAHSLIKQGADINAVDSSRGPTPLHVAVAGGNLEAVCMLLFYGADVSLLYESVTPIDTALKLKYYHITEVLVDYYENNQFIDSLLSYYLATNYLAAIHEATWCNSECIIIDEAAIVNWTPIFRILFEREPFNLFKIVWPKVTDDVLYNMNEPLLYTFFQTCSYSCSEFLECCFLILDSDNVLILLEQFNISTCHLWHLLAFIDNGKHEISRSNRLGLIYTFLSRGIHITLQDIVYVFNNNGYNKEIMALIYGGHLHNKISYHQKYCMLPITSFIFVLEENSSKKTIFKMFRNLAFRSFAIRPAEMQRFLYYLRFFSFSPVVKEKLINLCQIHINCNKEIVTKIRKMCTVPSLLEIGRNHTREFLKKKYKTKKAYQFHDVVKHLNIPQPIKHIIIYRTPIYD